ncbi:MAG: TauD/TfdA family dioxygenase [Pseudomonadota bacterium]
MIDEADPNFLSPRQDILEPAKADLKTNGWCCLHGLSRSDEALMAFVSALGSAELNADEHLTGPPIMDLKLDVQREKQAVASAYFTSDRFNLHTDLAYIDHPPRYILTHCVQPDPGGGGLTLLSDVKKAANLLSHQDREALADTVFSFLYPPGCEEGVSAPFAVIEEPSDGGTPKLRFRLDRTNCPQSHKHPLEHLADALVQCSFQLELRAGDLLIIDNTRMAHGRTALSRSGGPQRHLRRAYAAES